MLGIIFIYFIGKAFYTLAEEHDKNKWLFAITGVLSYYGGSFIGGIMSYLLYDMLYSDSYNLFGEPNELLITILGVALGLLICWLYYYLLKRNWENKVFQEDTTILDEDFTNNVYSDDDILEEDNWK